jgi:uncharacterized membrane protein YfcA
LFLLRPVLKFPTNTSTVITGGGISGLITGLLGTGGVLRATFLTGFNLEKAKYIATAAVIALATDATRIPSYLSQGFLLEQYYYYTITYASFLLLQCLVLVQYHIEG